MSDDNFMNFGFDTGGDPSPLNPMPDYGMSNTGTSPYYDAAGAPVYPGQESQSLGENHADDVPFGGLGRCKMCACRAYMPPVNGSICVNCGHDREWHL